MVRSFFALSLFGFVSLYSFSVAAQEESTPPRLIAFDGINELAMEASRQGMLSRLLRFTLVVGVDGKPKKCSIDYKFRRKIVEISLCRTLMKHHSFEPARDVDGNAVEGEYTNRIDFRSWLNTDGTSNLREM